MGTWLGCWLLGMMMLAAVVGCGSGDWFKELGGSGSVGLKGRLVAIKVLCFGALLCSMDSLSLLYSHESRVGCYVEGNAVCRGLLRTKFIVEDIC